MRISALLLGLVAAPALVAAQEYPTSPPPAARIEPAPFPPFQQARLSNGVRLVVVQSSKQPVVSISLSLPAGTRYDPAGKEGLADMVAGLLTKGAGTRTAEQISRAIEGVGGSINATAGPDFLTIRADVLAPDAPLAFGLVADAAARPTFAAKELDLLRTQTLSALQLELSQPAALAARFFARGLYGDTPYGRRTVPATVQAITRADLLRFQRERLQPRGALLVVAGDIGLSTARSLAERAMAGWTGTPAAAPALPAPPEAGSTEILLVNRPGSVQSNIIIGNTTFLPTSPLWYASVLANRILGGGADARLFLILREQKSWTYGAYSRLDRPKGIGSFQATAEVRTAVTDSALREMLVQIRRLGTEAVPDSEFANAKGSLVGQFPLTVETAEQVAGSVAEMMLLGLPNDYLSLYRTRLSQVTARQLQDAARAIARPERALIVVVGDGAVLYDRLRAIAPVRMVSVEGKPLTADDLSVRGTSLRLDTAGLAARRDSFTVLIQGNPMGAQASSLAKQGDTYTYTEETNIGSFVQQRTEVAFGADGTPRRLTRSGTVQGQPTPATVTFSGGRATGSATTPTPTGMQNVTVNAAVPDGTVAENTLVALLPALAWSPTAKYTVPVFSAGTNTVRPLTLSVAGTDSVTVPAGTFRAYRVEVTGGEQPITFYITTGQPARVVKQTLPGTPVELVLVK